MYSAPAAICSIEAPGLFYEIISRDPDPTTARFDLSFDNGNATGIFQMTWAG